MKYLNRISLVLILIVIIYLIVKEITVTPSRIGIVEMEKLVYDFQGMKDATQKYQQKLAVWNAQSDSLKQTLNLLYDELKLDSISGNKTTLQLNKQKFYYLQKSYYKQEQNISEKSQQEDQEMTIGILNQLKGYMSDFAKEHGYDIIINNTQMQNIGFVAKQNDITQELLEFSNRKYSGE